MGSTEFTSLQQVSVEEKLSQNERRVLAEAHKQFDLELAELRERIDAVHKVYRYLRHCYASDAAGAL